MDYAILKQELSAPQYATLLPDSPGTVADLLNAQTTTMVKTKWITALGVVSRLGASGAAILDKLEAVSASNSLVKWSMKFLQQEPGLNVGDPVAQQEFDDLAAAGVLTVGEAAALKALAVQSASRTEQLFGEGVRVEATDVLKALES